MQSIAIQEIKIACQDSTILAATKFAPQEELKGAVMLAPATGIKRQFYANFARYLAENGFAVLTFDNRGIGGSLHGKINTSNASLQCWGEKDMPAVLEQLKLAFPNTQYHLVGHSAGGQLVGLMHNAGSFASIFNYACSSGQLRNMGKKQKIRAHFFMNFFIPISNRVFGFTQSQWLGMGEPLPPRAAEQWRRWCNGQGYVKTAFGKSVFKHWYDELSMPSIWVNAIDDEIAVDKNVADMISVFNKLDARTLTLSASDYGLQEIGHMKFFSRKSKKIWEISLDWLNNTSALRSKN